MPAQQVICHVMNAGHDLVPVLRWATDADHFVDRRRTFPPFGVPSLPPLRTKICGSTRVLDSALPRPAPDSAAPADSGMCPPCAAPLTCSRDAPLLPRPNPA